MSANFFSMAEQPDLFSQYARNLSLRDYQQGLVDETINAWNKGNRRVCISLPTGGGKTEVCVHACSARDGTPGAYALHR
jgi:superfamily II DNA or RNA helicase